jgi:hypothetical protein
MIELTSLIRDQLPPSGAIRSITSGFGVPLSLSALLQSFNQIGPGSSDTSGEYDSFWTSDVEHRGPLGGGNTDLPLTLIYRDPLSLSRGRSICFSFTDLVFRSVLGDVLLFWGEAPVEGGG